MDGMADDLVVALHDFVPPAASANTCLSFRAGQLIRVLNRDPSGWWDGETVIRALDGSVVPWTDPDAPDAGQPATGLDGQQQQLGRRGWLPSNFTSPVGPNGLPVESLMMDRRPSASTISSTGSTGSSSNRSHHLLRPASPVRSATVDGSVTVPASGVGSADRTPRPDSPSRLLSAPADVFPSRAALAASASTPGAILDAVRSALADLSEAASACQVPLVQPATAQVISSVRAVLDAARCLTRESNVLGQHPSLARERRHILTVLSILVDKARRASVPVASEADEKAKRTEMEEMLFTADRVLAHVKKFLLIAEQAGVELLDPSSSLAEAAVDDAVRTISARSGSANTRRGLRLAQSSNDVRKATRRIRKGSDSGSSMASSVGPGSGPRSAPLPVEGRSHQAWMGHDDEAEEILSASSSSQHSEPRWRPAHSVSSSVSSISSSSHSPVMTPATAHTVLKPASPMAYKTLTSAELLVNLTSAHDRLVSTVAAFVGHASAHSRTSHPASYARLIDMTREAIDVVKDLLVLVEAVAMHAGIGRTRRKEVAALVEAKKGLYVATTALVTAARVATSPPQQNGEGGGPDAEDEEKNSLLSSATSVLGSGIDCISAVKVCISRFDGGQDSFKVAVQDHGDATVGVEEAATFADQDEDQTQTTITAWTPLGGGAAGKRERHTISMLGRKVDTLSVIRNAFEGVDSSALSNHLARFESGNECWPASTDDDARSEASAGVRPRSSGSTSMSGTSTATSVPAAGRTFHRHPFARAQTDPSPPMSTYRDRSASPSSQPMRREAVSSHTSAASSTTRISSQASTAASSPPPSLGGSPIDSAHSLRNTKEEEDWSHLLSRHSGAGITTTATLAAPTMGRSMSESVAKTLQQQQARQQQQHPVAQDWLHRRDYPPQEMSFNSNGGVTGGTLRSLVERMTLHDTPIEASFSTAFFLTFRMFADPAALADALADRFRIAFPADVPAPTAEQAKLWTEQKIVPVRLRVYNCVKTWLELHWRHEADSVALTTLAEFARRDVAPVMPAPGQRLLELVAKRAASGVVAAGGSSPVTSAIMGRQSSEGRMVSSGVGGPVFAAQNQALPPTPLIAKSVLQQLRGGGAGAGTVAVTDFDPLELARQITVMESRLFCAIRPEELLGQEFSKKSGVATHVRAMTALSTKITGWIAETILNEHDARKRTHLVKYFLKLGDRCHGLQNYNALMAIMTALNSSTISRLKKTWDGLNNKYRTIHETLNRAVNHARNYAEYRATLRHCQPPCLPFLGVYLTDITFCHEGNPTHRSSPLEPSLKLINFDRYQKMSKIIGDLQRFQMPFNVQELPEVQSYVQQALASLQHGGSPDSLYRRSLLVEPREPSDTSAAAAYQADLAGKTTSLFNWKGGELGRSVGIST